MKFWKGFASGFILAWILVWIYDWLAWRRRMILGTPISDQQIKRKVTTPQAKGDDLEEINGIGPTYARRLRESGVKTFTRLANMRAEQILEITKSSRGLGEVQNWITQAQELS